MSEDRTAALSRRPLNNNLPGCARERATSNPTVLKTSRFWRRRKTRRRRRMVENEAFTSPPFTGSRCPCGDKITYTTVDGFLRRFEFIRRPQSFAVDEWSFVFLPASRRFAPGLERHIVRRVRPLFSATSSRSGIKADDTKRRAAARCGDYLRTRRRIRANVKSNKPR